MPWWSWLVIWGGLGLALLGVLALSAWLLFRKFLVLVGDVDDLASRADVLSEVDADDELARPELAVLSDIRLVRARRAARIARNQERRFARRERRLARGRAILAVDPMTVDLPEGWGRLGDSPPHHN